MFISFIQVGDDENGLTEDNIRFVFGEIRRVLSFFQNEGVVLEGGVSYDEVYHSGNIIIGPAVVKAVLEAQKGKEGVWLDSSITRVTKNTVISEEGIS